MRVDWGITVHFGILPPDPDVEPDILDNIELTADSDDPTLRAALIVGEGRLVLGTVAELIEQLRGDTEG